MSCTDREFAQWKRQSAQKLDQSRKGGVDADIAPLVSLLNGLQQFFTTSSCSGRVIIIDGSAESSDIHKQNCQWLFVSHQKCTAEELISAVSRSSRDVVLKFEPFVLHVQCRRLEDAQLMHSAAVNSGFRNTGLTVGKSGKIISAVRSTHGLEVPLSQGGSLLVSHQYIHFLCDICNVKMEENLRRIHRFEENLQRALTTAADVPTLRLPECTGSQSPQSAHEDTAEPRDVYRRRRRREQTDCCHDDRSDGRDGDGDLTELNDCLDLFS